MRIQEGQLRDAGNYQERKMEAGGEGRGRSVGGEVGDTRKQKQGNKERSRPIGSHLKNR